MLIPDLLPGSRDSDRESNPLKTHNSHGLNHTNPITRTASKPCHRILLWCSFEANDYVANKTNLRHSIIKLIKDLEPTWLAFIP
jgi:hypothetical protein